MGKLNHGPSSRAVGKAGAWVYQQYEGMQVFREYQPNIKNPQTAKQTENRSNFKLASQTVGVFKEVINTRLAKFSIYTRIRRGAAVEAIKRKITWDGDHTSTLLFTDAIAALNSKALTEYGAPAVVATNSQFQVTAPAESNIIGVIAGFDSDGNYIGRKLVTGTGTSSAVNFSIPADFNAAKAMFVYTVANTEEGRAIYDNVTDPGASLFVDVQRLVNSGDIEVSDIAGSNVTRE